MDLAAAVMIAMGFFGVSAGKVAARKNRSWLVWCALGAFLGPVALIILLLRHRLDPCPSCGELIVLKPGRACPFCAREIPAPLNSSRVSASILGMLGFKLGAKEAAVERMLSRAGIDYRRTPEGELCYSGELYGRQADVAVDLSSGRAESARVVYAEDDGYRIYYDLKRVLVAEFGRSACEDFDGGRCDSWSTRKLMVSLSTATPRGKGAPPETSLICLRLTAGQRKNDGKFKNAEIDKTGLADKTENTDDSVSSAGPAASEEPPRQEGLT